MIRGVTIYCMQANTRGSTRVPDGMAKDHYTYQPPNHVNCHRSLAMSPGMTGHVLSGC